MTLHREPAIAQHPDDGLVLFDNFEIFRSCGQIREIDIGIVGDEIPGPDRAEQRAPAQVDRQAKFRREKLLEPGDGVRQCIEFVS